MSLASPHVSKMPKVRMTTYGFTLKPLRRNKRLPMAAIVKEFLLRDAAAQIAQTIGFSFKAAK